MEEREIREIEKKITYRIATRREADNWSGLAAGEVDFSPTCFFFVGPAVPRAAYIKLLFKHRIYEKLLQDPKESFFEGHLHSRLR